MFLAVWVNSVVKVLKAEYNRRSQLRPLLWDNTIELPLKNVYTRLKIVSRRKLAIQMIDDRVNVFNIFKAPFKGADVTKLAGRSSDLHMDESEADAFDVFAVPDKVEDVMMPAEGENANLLREHDEVKVFEIFKTLEKGEDVMTLVEGSPGIGKTTFCLKLAYDWAHGKIPAECPFPKFEFVLLLKCRDIDGNIMDTIREQLLPRGIDEESVEKLLRFMKDIHNQDKILIILDGLDELPEKSQHHVDELLHRRILPFCYVLATSRQERGIEVRKRFVFDIHLEIKGYTESDAFEYIRKHFANVGRGHSSKGERLIAEIKDNEFLHALRTNPLNLFLLCVIYEDYEGKLPSARFKLYQVIVQCLLRRYCAKHNLQDPKNDNALEKYFEKDIFALGELAWMCLLSDRYCLRESELAELERRYKGLVSRDIGLLYKEESLKRLNPQHQYYFLHKSFQEYLAATYIAHKLRGNQLNLFERLSFDDLVVKYHEVFLFVSGILGKDASILFTQIGEELRNWGHWVWDTCTQSLEMNTYEEEEPEDSLDDSGEELGWAAATFLTKSFIESGNDQEMAVTLCSYIPFPQHVYIDLDPEYGNVETGITCIYHVLKACKNFQKLQTPVQLTFRDSLNATYEYCAEYIQSCSQLQILTIFSPAVTSDLATALHKGLSGNTTLSVFTLEVRGSIPCDAAFIIGELLAGRKSLRRVSFLLDRVRGGAWASAIETGLSADTLLSSVELKVYGPLSVTAINALGKLVSNEAMTKFSLTVSGDVQEVLATISNGIARQTTLKSLVLNVCGNLSLSNADFLQSSLIENRSLNDVKVSVFGDVPQNWQTVVKTLRWAKKAPVTVVFHPDPCSKVADSQVVPFCSHVAEKESETKQYLTVVVWGELSSDGAEALCKLLVRGSPTSLTLKVHGNITVGIADCIAKYVRQYNALSSLTIDIWGELALGSWSVLNGLTGYNVNVQLKRHDILVVPDESCNTLDVSIESPASLASMFSRVKDTRKEKVNLKVLNDSEETKDWAHLLGDALASNTSLTALDLTINNYMMTVDLVKDLGESLLRSSSLTVLSLVINNYNNMADGWEWKLVKILTKLMSLTTLNLAISENGELSKFKFQSLNSSLLAITSLSKLSVVISGSNMNDFWSNFLRNCLKENPSLATLCLTINDYEETDSALRPEHWVKGLADGLASTTSLNELTVTINNITSTEFSWMAILFERISVSKSITSLTVTVSDYKYLSCKEWVEGLNVVLARNKMLTTLTLTVNDFSEGERHEGWTGVSDYLLNFGFTQTTSLTELNLTVNIRSEVSEDWLPQLCDVFLKGSSLKTLRLQINDQCGKGQSHLYDLSQLRLKCGSLSLFDLTVTFYGE